MSYSFPAGEHLPAGVVLMPCGTAGLTQEEAARRLGKPQSYVSKCEERGAADGLCGASDVREPVWHRRSAVLRPWRFIASVAACPVDEQRPPTYHGSRSPTAAAGPGAGRPSAVLVIAGPAPHRGRQTQTLTSPPSSSARTRNTGTEERRRAVGIMPPTAPVPRSILNL